MLDLMRCFSYTPDARFNEEFLSVILLLLVFVRSFPYIPNASNSGEFLVHS